MTNQNDDVFRRIARIKRDYAAHEKALEEHKEKTTISSAEELVAGHKVDKEKREKRRARYYKRRWTDAFIATDGKFLCSFCKDLLPNPLDNTVRIRYRKPTSRVGAFQALCASCFSTKKCKPDELVTLRLGRRSIVFNAEKQEIVRIEMRAVTATPRVIEEWVIRLIDEFLDL